jgi:hypothetical protein
VLGAEFIGESFILMVSGGWINLGTIEGKIRIVQGFAVQAQRKTWMTTRKVKHSDID